MLTPFLKRQAHLMALKARVNDSTLLDLTLEVAIATASTADIDWDFAERFREPVSRRWVAQQGYVVDFHDSPPRFLIFTERAIDNALNSAYQTLCTENHIALDEEHRRVWHLGSLTVTEDAGCEGCIGFILFDRPAKAYRYFYPSLPEETDRWILWLDGYDQSSDSFDTAEKETAHGY